MEVQDLQIPTEKGHSLSATSFRSKGTIKKTLIISSATGVLQGYYRKFALHFAQLGYTVFTYDYYGIGKSSSSIRDLKKNNFDLKSWGYNDQAAMVRFARSRLPQNELILLTHSIGGQILGFNKEHGKIDKIVMVASQSGYWKYFKGWHFPKMWLFWNVMIPLLTPVFGYFPAKKVGLFENLPRQMVYQWARWGRKPNYMMHDYNKNDYFFDQIKKPIFSLSFPKDHFAPKQAVDWLTTQFTNADISRYHHPHEGPQPFHFGFFREQFKDPLWDMTNTWILNS